MTRTRKLLIFALKCLPGPGQVIGTAIGLVIAWQVLLPALGYEVQITTSSAAASAAALPWLVAVLALYTCLSLIAAVWSSHE